MKKSPENVSEPFWQLAVSFCSFLGVQSLAAVDIQLWRSIHARYLDDHLITAFSLSAKLTVFDAARIVGIETLEHPIFEYCGVGVSPPTVVRKEIILPDIQMTFNKTFLRAPHYGKELIWGLTHMNLRKVANARLGKSRAGKQNARSH